MPTEDGAWGLSALVSRDGWSAGMKLTVNLKQMRK